MSVREVRDVTAWLRPRWLLLPWSSSTRRVALISRRRRLIAEQALYTYQPDSVLSGEMPIALTISNAL